MAGSLLFIKDMNKRLLGLSCSSAASASVITGRAIDRHSPHLRDPHRSMSKPPKAKPTTGSRDSSSSSSSSFSSSKQQLYGKKKKSSTSTSTRSSSSSSGIKRLVSPASSSRFLLNSSSLQSDDVNVAELALPPPPPPPFIDIFPGDAMPVPFPGEEAPAVQLAESSAGSSASAASSSSEIAAVVGISSRDHDEKAVIMRSCSTRTQDQVVVLRVSLHCKGCAGKVKKHISKMEGVASFDIDIATKKVTIVGNVTPLAVLSSISKVKPAQFWPSPPRPPRASASF